MTPSALSNETLDELLAAAAKATPGPWYQTGAPWFRDGTGVLAGSPDGNVAYLIADTDDFALPRDEYEGFPLGDKEDDARFIALANPATLTALITELQSYRSDRAPSGGEPEPVVVGWRWRHSGGPWRFLDNGEMPDDRDAYITSQPGYEVAPVFASPPSPSGGEPEPVGHAPELMRVIAEAAVNVAERHPDLRGPWRFDEDELQALASRSRKYLGAAASPPKPSEAMVATHRHVKCGSEYVLIGYGKMQSGKWKTPTIRPEEDGENRYTHVSIDMREVAIYRSIDDGSLWVRPREEFDDGSFIALTAALSGGAK